MLVIQNIVSLSFVSIIFIGVYLIKVRTRKSHGLVFGVLGEITEINGGIGRDPVG